MSLHISVSLTISWPFLFAALAEALWFQSSQRVGYVSQLGSQSYKLWRQHNFGVSSLVFIYMFVAGRCDVRNPFFQYLPPSPCIFVSKSCFFMCPGTLRWLWEELSLLLVGSLEVTGDLLTSLLSFLSHLVPRIARNKTWHTRALTGSLMSLHGS